ncbi:MAG: hypothetical protein R6U85_00430 [Salinivirgaceae bacterium]
MEFNSLSWHDSIIESINIDRRNPGKNDIVRMEISWANGEKNIISFKDVYWADLNMNFGIVSPESILKAYSEGGENEIVKSFYSKWKGMINDVDLNYYEIETNSTNSKIRIIAQKFEIE